MMRNSLGSQLWSVYEELKRNRKIGFLTDEEFQRYFLGFVSYKYLSENLELYLNNELKEDNLDFQEAYKNDDYKDLLRDQSVKELGYFLRPNLLFKNIVSPRNYGTIIIEELEKAFKEISDSSINTESQEDFQNLFEGVDLNASQLGKRLEDKNRVVFNILDALSFVNFNLDKQNFKLNQGNLKNYSKYHKTPAYSPNLANDLFDNNVESENLIKSNVNLEKDFLLKKSLSNEKVSADADSLSIDKEYNKLSNHRHYDSFEDLAFEYDSSENLKTPSVGEGFEYLLKLFCRRTLPS